MGTIRGRQLTELRRSNAAGVHNHRPTRTELKKQAIKEETDMAILYPDFDLESQYDDQWGEPTDEELDDIEAEEYIPSEVYFFDEYFPDEHALN